MQHMLADLDQIRAYAYGSGSQKDAESAAVDLTSWSQRIGELFPPGQASTEYVDMSYERARDAPAAMRSSADRLLAAVRTGKPPTVSKQVAATERDGCGFCHRSGSH